MLHHLVKLANRKVILYILAPLLLLGCQLGANQPVGDFLALPTFRGDTLQAVIEIPAGTNHKIEYDKNGKRFVNDTLNGSIRIIDFLPYPGNYGFIPSTLMDEAQGGDGDALDILVIGETVPTGTVMAVEPIATLLLRDNGELDTKIIAVPKNPELKVFQPSNFLDFMLHYDAGRRMIEEWFLNYKGPNQMELIRWEDDQYALSEIQKWRIAQ